MFVIPPEVFSTGLTLFRLVTMISPYLAFLFFRKERVYQSSTLDA